MFFGNIGSDVRLDFTVVGSAVNEVNRIASMCRSVDRDSGPDDEMSETIALLLEMYPNASNSARIRAMKYRLAVEDLPAWTVREAIKRWLRGEDGEGKENYAFAPEPPQLRRLALRVRIPVKNRVFKLDRLLKAEILPPERPKIYTTAEQAAKLQTVIDAAIEATSLPSEREPEGRSTARPNHARVLADIEARKARRAASDESLPADHSEAAE